MECSWKLPRNIFMEVAIEGSNGSFHSHRRWKLPCTALEASINFHGKKKLLAWKFHGSWWKLAWNFPWALVEASIEMDRTEVGRPLWKSCWSSWKFVILVEAGASIRGIWKLMEASAEYIRRSCN